MRAISVVLLALLVPACAAGPDPGARATAIILPDGGKGYSMRGLAKYESDKAAEEGLTASLAGACRSPVRLESWTLRPMPDYPFGTFNYYFEAIARCEAA